MALDFPASPTNGQVYGSYTYNSTVGAWQSREDSRTVAVLSATVPVSANPGDIWINTNDGIAFVYYNDGTSAQWMELLPSGVPLLSTKADLSGATFTGNITAPKFISNIATGTPPLEVTSTTLVSNLNADLLDGSHASAFSPVAGSASITTVGTIGTGTWNATTIGVAKGGTGATTLTGYVKGSGTSAFTASATIPGSDISGNISGNAASVTGTVGVANGGTGATTGSALVPIIPTGGSYTSVSANGLITFSGGVRADGIFSALYDSYVIILNVTSASAADYLYFRYCTGGVANNASSYYNGSMFHQVTTVASWSNGSTVNSYSGRVGYYLSDNATNAIFEIHGPFGTATKTNAVYRSKYYATNPTFVTGAVGFNATTSFDGILFNGEAGTGTPNGTMQVFGYRK